MCILQGTYCDTGIPCTFYGENICSVCMYLFSPIYLNFPLRIWIKLYKQTVYQKLQIFENYISENLDKLGHMDRPLNSACAWIWFLIVFTGHAAGAKSRAFVLCTYVKWHIGVGIPFQKQVFLFSDKPLS